MPHPHNKSIINMNASSLISIIEDSKITYVRENLDIHLHRSQIKLLKEVRKHEKPHHKRIRVKRYEEAEKDDLFNLHLDLYLNRYEKLSKKGLIEIDNSRFAWKFYSDSANTKKFDFIALRLLDNAFREYQETGKIPEKVYSLA